jgi:hypothetical protein
MVSRYGKHLIETWELDPNRYPDPPPSNYYAQSVQATAPSAQPESADDSFKFTEPIEL